MSAFDESLGAAPDAVPSADEVLGPPPPDDDLPTTEDVLPPRSSIDNTPPPDGEAVSDLVARSSTGRVLDAFGQGRANGWGMRPLDTISPEAAAELNENGLLKLYEDWRANSALTVNQALMRPAAAALVAASRANNGFSGLQSATAQAFADAGRPDLASDVLSMPGALFGSLYSPGLATGELERARSLGVIGVGAAGWKGTAAEFAAAEGQDAQGQGEDTTASEPGAEAATPETLPDKLRALVKNWPAPDTPLSFIRLGKDFVEGLAELLEGAHGDLPVGRPLSPKAVGAFVLLAPEGSVVPRTIGAAGQLLGIGKNIERGSGERAATEGAAAAETKGAGEAPAAVSKSAAEAPTTSAAVSASTAPSAESGAAAASEAAAAEAPSAARQSAPPSTEGAVAAEGNAAGETAAAPSEGVPTQAPEEAPVRSPTAREEAPAPRSTGRETTQRKSKVAEERTRPSPRTAFPEEFPNVVIQQPDGSAVRVRAHVDYAPAKAGDVDAANRLVNDVLDPAKVQAVRGMIGDRHPIVVAVHAEGTGRNKIPQVYAEMLARRLGLKTDDAIVQANRPMRTGATGLHRITTRSEFDGPVEAGKDYLIVDDRITQGGTLADLRAYIEERGGKVIGATTLMGNDKSAALAPLSGTLARLREKFPGLEPWWKEHFGYGFDGLTQSEAAYLDRYNSADAIRNSVLARGQKAHLGADEGTPRPTGGTRPPKGRR